MKPEEPKRIDINEDELMGILKIVESHLTHHQYKILQSAIKMLVWLQFSIKEKSLSIARLGRLLFGKKNENLKNLKNRAKGQGDSSARETDQSCSSDVDTLNKETEDCDHVESEESQAASSGIDNLCESSSENKPAIDLSNNNEGSISQPTLAEAGSAAQPVKKEKKGHGRHRLDDYNFSKIIHIPHDQLKAGEKCPLCKTGTVYYIDPEVLLVIRGQPPLKTEAYSAQGLRCNLCQAVFRATFPKEVITQPRADITARAIVCLAKYQLGTPLYRLETWQYLLGVPISDSEMWEWTESVALALFPVHQALINMASKGEVIHNDDTNTKVLDLIKENELAKDDKDHRKGMFTSILLSKVEGREIALYFTGRKNSGENLDELLDRRPNSDKRPVQACDASTQNLAERHETDLAKCLNHARHNFCELVEVWPKEIMKIIEMINTVFFNDRITKKMDEKERLKYHQEHSLAIMNELKSYCIGLLDNKIVEPNSGFGKAIKYVNNHWEGLTLFLRNGKAPLSNNDAERALKSYVLLRKNSYFYKTCWGAFVGDTLLSTIKTCALNGINPYDYLIAIQANANELSKNPCGWMPWNYMENTGAFFVQTQPVQEMYQHNPTGPPFITPVIPQPNLEGQKPTLRERARDFFRRIYPEKCRPLVV